MKICNKCKMNYGDTDSFCQNCGSKLEIVEGQVVDTAQQNEQTNQIQPQDNNKRITILLILTIVGFILSIWLIIFGAINVYCLLELRKMPKETKKRKGLLIANIAMIVLYLIALVYAVFEVTKKPYIGEFKCAAYSIEDNEKFKGAKYDLNVKFDDDSFKINDETASLSGTYKLKKRERNNDGTTEYILNLKIKERMLYGEKYDGGDDDDKVYEFSIIELDDDEDDDGEFVLTNSNSLTAYVCKKK